MEYVITCHLLEFLRLTEWVHKYSTVVEDVERDTEILKIQSSVWENTPAGFPLLDLKIWANMLDMQVKQDHPEYKLELGNFLDRKSRVFPDRPGIMPFH